MVEMHSTDSEIPLRIEAGSIVRSPKRLEIKASEDQRMAIAGRLGLLRIDRFEASVALRRTPVGLIELQGSLSAHVVQECVVTLEPVSSRTEVEFDGYYSENPQDAPHAVGDAALHDEMWPEPVEDGWIDVGEAVIQELAVALDPYPRKPDAGLEVAEFESETSDTHRPFSRLKEINAKRAGPEEGR